MGKLTRKAFRELIKEDLEWLESLPHCLERMHVIEIVKSIERYEYGPETAIERAGRLVESGPKEIRSNK